MNAENGSGKHPYSLLATCIERLCRVYWGPSEELVEQILTRSFLQPFESASGLAGAKLGFKLKELDRLLQGFSVSDNLFSYLEEGYVRLFVNDRGGIAAPLYASCYPDRGRPQLMGPPAIRTKALLTRLGMHIAGPAGEPPDHLAIQLEILYYLLTREAAPGPDHGATPAARFTADHMLPWVRRFNQQLAREERCRFYPLAACIMLEILEAIGAFSRGRPLEGSDSSGPNRY